MRKVYWTITLAVALGLFPALRAATPAVKVNL